MENRNPLGLGLPLGILLFFGFLPGCVHVISKDVRAQADLTLTYQQVSQNPEAYKGKTVIWGGEIIATTNQKDKTTAIEVLQRPLDIMEEPKETSPAEGRFLILVNSFLDPYIYRQGRKITVAGEIRGEKIKPLGEGEYRYPLIQNKQIYLWQEDLYPYPYPYPYYYYPWDYYGPWRHHPPWW